MSPVPPPPQANSDCSLQPPDDTNEAAEREKNKQSSRELLHLDAFPTYAFRVATCTKRGRRVYTLSKKDLKSVQRLVPPKKEPWTKQKCSQAEPQSCQVSARWITQLQQRRVNLSQSPAPGGAAGGLCQVVIGSVAADVT